MRTRTENLTDVVAPKANWPLALGAGLLGIGQNGLLVMLPQLVSLTGLSLSVWAGLLMFGSMLFLPASPWWGRQSERHGCKSVMLSGTELTLKGLEYLEENSLMKKAADLAKGIVGTAANMI